MRAIPIDRFLESVEAGRTQGSSGSLPLPLAADWARIVTEGRAARAQADGGFWRIGQLANLVERRYRSGALERFAREIGESHGTVRRLRWVVGRYEPGIRFRFPKLSFSHFQAVAGQPERTEWLARADRAAWSVDRLVHEVRAAGAARPPRRPKPEQFRPKIEAAQRSLSELAALDDRTIRTAADEWLGDALSALARELAALEERVKRLRRRAGRGRVVRLPSARRIGARPPRARGRR